MTRCCLPAENRVVGFGHGRMARGGHGLPKVSPGPAMPYPSTPCGRVTRETALWLFLGWRVNSAGGLRPSSTPWGTLRRKPLRDSRNTSQILSISWDISKMCHKWDRTWTVFRGLVKPLVLYALWVAFPGGHSCPAHSASWKILNLIISIYFPS
jgi:hypothetical protein